MSRRVWRVGLLVAVVIAVAIFVASSVQSAAKVTICHRSTNPQKTQTISVNESAVPAHQGHGDTLGACPVSPSR